MSEDREHDRREAPCADLPLPTEALARAGYILSFPEPWQREAAERWDREHPRPTTR